MALNSIKSQELHGYTRVERSLVYAFPGRGTNSYNFGTAFDVGLRVTRNPIEYP